MGVEQTGFQILTNSFQYDIIKNDEKYASHYLKIVALSKAEGVNLTFHKNAEEAPKINHQIFDRPLQTKKERDDLIGMTR